MTAFRQVVNKLQDGQREEAMIGLEFVLRLDPTFRPALNLQRQLASGAAEIDLSGMISELHAPSTDAINLALVEAVEAFDRRDFAAAKTKVEEVLKDLPGHQDARHLHAQIIDALKVETQVTQFLTQAQEALAQNDHQEAANFVMMAQALDPHHAGISEALAQIQAAAPDAAPLPQAPSPVAPPGAFQAPDEGAGEAFRLETERGAFGDDQAMSGLGAVSFGDEAGGDAPAFGFDTVPPSDSNMSPVGFDGASDDWASQGPVFGSGDDEPTFQATAGDVADLFEPPDAAATAAAASIPELPPADDEPNEQLRSLLQAGDEAFRSLRFAQAIHFWSRVLVTDPDHAAATARIDSAHQALEDQRRRLTETISSARGALARGDRNEAFAAAEEALAIDPISVTAAEIRDAAGAAHPTTPETASAAPPHQSAAPAGASSFPGAEMPELEDELFHEESDEELAVEAAVDEELSDLTTVDEEVSLPPVPRRKGLPLGLIGIAVGGLVVVLAGVWLGSKLFSSDASPVDTGAVNAVLSQAKELYEQRRVEDAVQLLRSFPDVGDPDQQARIDKKIAEYEQTLAPPTPTPIPDAVGVAEGLLAANRLLDAYAVVVQGLADHPGDEGLAELRQQILTVESRLGSLHGSVADGRHAAAVGLAQDILNEHPGWTDVQQVLERSLFNASLVELRSYNLTAAESYLRQLEAARPGDPEVARVIEFVERYKARPVDMQLKIFIRSLEER